MNYMNQKPHHLALAANYRVFNDEWMARFKADPNNVGIMPHFVRDPYMLCGYAPEHTVIHLLDGYRMSPVFGSPEYDRLVDRGVEVVIDEVGEERTKQRQAKCPHQDFHANVRVARLEDSGRFQAEVTVTCNHCWLPFSFLGLPAGLNLEGAAVSPDGLEARLAISPGTGGIIKEVADKGQQITGFSIKHKGTF